MSAPPATGKASRKSCCLLGVAITIYRPRYYCLFRRSELEERFDGWTVLESRTQTFPAPGGTRKDFSTIIAEKPSQKTEKVFKTT